MRSCLPPTPSPCLLNEKTKPVFFRCSVDAERVIWWGSGTGVWISELFVLSCVCCCCSLAVLSLYVASHKNNYDFFDVEIRACRVSYKSRKHAECLTSRAIHSSITIIVLSRQERYYRGEYISVSPRARKNRINRLFLSLLLRVFFVSRRAG